MNDSKVVILSHPESAETDRRLQNIIAFAGLESLVIFLDEESASNDALQRLANAESTCVMSSAIALFFFLEKHPDAWDHSLKSSGQKMNLFIYGFCSENLQVKLAGKITGGVVSFIFGLNGCLSVYQVTASRREITQEFTGLSFGPIDPQTDFAFGVAENAQDLSCLVLIGDLPHFVSLELPSYRLFLLACTGVADILEDSAGRFGAADYFSKLVPALMFLKHCFGTRCWHSPQKHARFIIDDPILRESYGFLRYDKFLEATAGTDIGLSIAFIPRNYKRTDRSVADMFRRNASRLSLCIHGCDHSEGEFGTADEGELNSRVMLAIHRMNHLSHRTAITHENVMIFPREEFSTQALKAVKCNNLLGAVSCAMPKNRTKDDGLKVADFLTPAVTFFHGFPLFVRRYPREVIKFAWDFFFNRPALVFEHHGYFKKGYRDLIEMGEKLNAMSPGLQWARLDYILTNTQFQRRVKDGVILCRMFTNSQVIENFGDVQAMFIVSKTEPDVSLIEALMVNGKRQGFEVRGNEISFRAMIPARCSVHASLLYRNILPTPEQKIRGAYTTKLFVRQHLSEFRDNILARNDLLLRIVDKLKYLITRKS